LASPPGSTASPEKRADLDFEVIDLRDYPLPLFNERGSLAWEPIKTEVAQRWAAKLAGLDGFIPDHS
jgi:NAD(P)H-dependent FMN reductase